MSDWKTAIRSAIYILVLTVVLYLVLDTSQFIEEVNRGVGGFIALAAALVLVFLLNLVTAPAAIDSERQAQISEFEKRLNDREHASEIVRPLRSRLKRLQSLRVHLIGEMGPIYAEVAAERIEICETQICELLENLGVDERFLVKFESTRQLSYSRSLPRTGFDPIYLEIVDEKIEILRSIILEILGEADGARKTSEP